MTKEVTPASTLPVEHSDPDEDRSSGAAIALGLIVDVGGSILATKVFVLSMLMLGASVGYFWSSLLMFWCFVIGLAGVFSGSFLAARFAPDKPMAHAAVILLLDLWISFSITAPGIATWLFLAYAAFALPACYSGGTVAKWVREPQKNNLLEERDEPHLLE